MRVEEGKKNYWKFLQGREDKLATVPMQLYSFRELGTTCLSDFPKSEVVEASGEVHPGVGEEDREGIRESEDAE